MTNSWFGKAVSVCRASGGHCCSRELLYCWTRAPPRCGHALGFQCHHADDYSAYASPRRSVKCSFSNRRRSLCERTDVSATMRPAPPAPWSWPTPRSRTRRPTTRRQSARTTPIPSAATMLGAVLPACNRKRNCVEPEPPSMYTMDGRPAVRGAVDDRVDGDHSGVASAKPTSRPWPPSTGALPTGRNAMQRRRSKSQHAEPAYRCWHPRSQRCRAPR